MEAGLVQESMGVEGFRAFVGIEPSGLARKRGEADGDRQDDDRESNGGDQRAAAVGAPGLDQRL